MNGKQPSEVWSEYQSGVDYNTSIDLYETVKVNENMYLGKQWEGVNAPDLPKPVLNIMKPTVAYKTAMIVSDDVAVSFTAHNSAPYTDAMAKLLSKQVERVIEQSKVKTMHRDLIRNSAVDGDCCVYLWFDPDVETGQDAKGDIKAEIIENINVLFGNPYITDVQRQPHIIIAQRRTVQEAKKEAKDNGTEGWDTITPDEDTNQMEQGDSKLCTVLVKLWKENGTVWAQKSTEKVIVQEAKDTGYKLYPLAWMPWEKVKSCYHGQAVITGLVPNQISINRLFAMTIRSVELNAFPKIVYDSTRIAKWTNKVGEAIGVNGMVNDAIAQPLRGGDVSAQVMQIIDSTISMTKDLMGASDAALGNVKPDNTSAIIAVQQAAAVPLELQKRAFYQFVEDYVRVMIEIMSVDYGIRVVNVDEELMQSLAPAGYGMPIMTMPVDFSQLGDVNYELNIDAGASTFWSELTQVQTLDALYSKQIITDAVSYLEAIPDHYIKNKNKLIEQIKTQQAAQMAAQPMLPNTPQGV